MGYKRNDGSTENLKSNNIDNWYKSEPWSNLGNVPKDKVQIIIGKNRVIT